MAFSHGRQARFYWHGVDMSQYLQGVNQRLTRSMGEHRPLNGDAVIRLPGLKDLQLTLAGTAWEAATSDLHIFTRLDEETQRVFAYLPAGDVVGGVAYCGLSRAGTMGIVAGDDIIRIPTGLVSAEEFDRSKILHLLTASGSSPGSSVDNGAQTTNGGAAYLICTATDGGDLDVTVEDSPNDADWSTLLAMTTLTAVGAEEKEVAGTVDRYLRVSWTLSAGSATWFLAFGRR